jgi:S1-C subfamily serine protease
MTGSRAYAVLAAILLAACAASAAWAGPPADLLRAVGVPAGRTGQAGDMEALQTDLSWIGLHEGQISGTLDAATRASGARFQASIGRPATGVLDGTERRLLRERAARVEAAAGFRSQRVEWVGVRLDVPAAFYGRPEIDHVNREDVLFEGTDTARSRIALRRYDRRASAETWLRVFSESATKDDGQILARGSSGAYLYVVSVRDGRRRYVIGHAVGDELRTLDITLAEDEAVYMRPVIGHMIASFEPRDGPGVPEAAIGQRLRDGDYPGGRDLPEWQRTMMGNGSGSVVSTDGHVLTNHHVVSGCTRVTANGSAAILIGTDIRLDLALLRVPDLVGRRPVRFSERPAQLGDEILVLGYPVFSLSPALNATYGIVSSPVGLEGDRTNVQITAPVQPGNSGGPVLSIGGAQVAVVASKVTSALREARNIENIGWVVRGIEAERFLERFDVRVLRSRNSFERPPGALSDQLRDWRRFVVRIECHAS